MDNALTISLEACYGKPFKELPGYLQEWVMAALPSLASRWDELTTGDRRGIAEEWARESCAENKDGETVGWWDRSMDASKWWRVESIAPLDAAMLLCRHNPHEESRSSVENSSSDELGPDDFKMLLVGFEGAPPSRRTLKDWANYATERGFKIHSWFGEWEAAKRRTAPEFFADEQETPEETATSSQEDLYERLLKQKEELAPDWGAVANKATLDVTDWMRLTGSKITSGVKAGDCEVSPNGVRVRPYSEAQIANTAFDDQLIMLTTLTAGQLRFPCTPSELLETIDTNEWFSMYFVVPDGFRNAVIALRDNAKTQKATEEHNAKTFAPSIPETPTLQPRQTSNGNTGTPNDASPVIEEQPKMKKKAILEGALGKRYPELENAFHRGEQWIKDCSAGKGKYFLAPLEKGCIENWGDNREKVVLAPVSSMPKVAISGMKDGKKY